MTTTAKKATRIRRTVTGSLAVAAMGAAVLGPVAVAQADTSRPPGTATLSIGGAARGNHTLTVTGKVETGSLAQAKELLKTKFFVVVWGDDNYNDDFIDFGNYYTWSFATSTGAYFSSVFPIRDDHLNEDYGKDEIYVEVATTKGVIRSNNVSGSF
jgi:hypothetical protein